MNSISEHWNKIYSSTENSKLGWYEKDTSKTFELLNLVPSWNSATIFLPGAGTSVLIDQLLERGTKLVLNDISLESLNKVRDRLRKKSSIMYRLCQDISQPIKDNLPDIDIWIDRAVLHFLTNEEDIKGYFQNVNSVIRTSGYVIFAEYSKVGASRGVELDVHRYSVEEISERLGSSFRQKSSFEHTYINPNGDPRPYIYVLFEK